MHPFALAALATAGLHVDDFFGDGGIADDDLKTAFAEAQKEAKAEALKAMVKDLMEAQKHAVTMRDNNKVSIRRLQAQIQSHKNFLDMEKRAKAYGVATSNYIPWLKAICSPLYYRAVQGSRS